MYFCITVDKINVKVWLKFSNTAYPRFLKIICIHIYSDHNVFTWAEEKFEIKLVLSCQHKQGVINISNFFLLHLWTLKYLKQAISILHELYFWQFMHSLIAVLLPLSAVTLLFSCFQGRIDVAFERWQANFSSYVKNQFIEKK